MSQIRYSNEVFPPVIKNLVIINLLVWVAQITLSTRFQLTDMLTVHPIISERLSQALSQIGAPELQKFNPYQLVTYMFAHAAITGPPANEIIFTHIFFNLFAIWMFGRTLENYWGSKRFLFFYLAAGVGAGIIHLIVQYIRCEFLL